MTGFWWDRRLQLYLLSFPLPYFLFMSGQSTLSPQNMMAVIPFAALFAAIACVQLVRRLQAWWPGQTAAVNGLAGLALVALVAVPGREAFALGWTLGHRPDTRTAAVEWLRQHVVTSGPLARPTWPLRTVKIDRAMP